MPALYEQLPGELDIVVTHSDALTITRSLGVHGARAVLSGG